MIKIVGQVTDEEKEDIKEYFQRKLALQSLVKTIIDHPDKMELYEKVVKDLGDVEFNLQAWWKQKAKEYQWQAVEHGFWSINFETNEIYLNFE